MEGVNLMIINGLKSSFDGTDHWNSTEYSYQDGKSRNFLDMYYPPIFTTSRNTVKKELYAVRAF